MARHLRVVEKPSSRHDCRTPGCEFPAQPPLGYCRPCEAVYHAARELRERLLDRRGAYVRARHHSLLAALTPTNGDRLVAHIVAHTADRRESRTVLDIAGLDDFLGELKELRLTS